MTPELIAILVVKSTIVAVIALLVSAMLRRRPARDQVAALRAGTLALLALPAAALLLPSLDISVLAAAPPSPPAAADMGTATDVPAALPTPTLLSPMVLLAIAYSCGTLYLLARLAIGLVTLARWTRRSAPVDDPHWLAALDGNGARGMRLRVSEDIAAPLSWGVWPAFILIDRDTLRHSDRAEAVIAHEMAHVRGLDWPALVLSRAATALLWVNPLVWLVERALSRRAEIAADEAAAVRVERVGYAQMLLDLAGGAPAMPACTMAGPPSLLAERVRYILSDRRPQSAGPIVPLAILGGAAILAAPLAAARLVVVTPMAESEAIALPAQLKPAVTTDAPVADFRKPVADVREPQRLAARGARVRRPAPPPPARLAVDKRQAACELSERARGLRAQAKAIMAANKAIMAAGPRSGPGRDPPERAMALRADADRLDMAARRQLFGR